MANIVIGLAVVVIVLAVLAVILERPLHHAEVHLWCVECHVVVRRESKKDGERRVGVSHH
jgi:hypothetical protein